MILAGNERELQRAVKHCYNASVWRKLRVNVGKIKVMVFKKNEVKAFEISTPYKVNVPVTKHVRKV